MRRPASLLALGGSSAISISTYHRTIPMIICKTLHKKGRVASVIIHFLNAILSSVVVVYSYLIVAKVIFNIHHFSFSTCGQYTVQIPIAHKNWHHLDSFSPIFHGPIAVVYHFLMNIFIPDCSCSFESSIQKWFRYAFILSHLFLCNTLQYSSVQ